jgi:hypothetical protein
MEKRIVTEDVCVGMAIKNNNTRDYNHIKKYEDFDISEVKVNSNGKKIISIGDFEKESCLDFSINFEDFYNERLINIDKINDCEIEFINIIFKGFSFNNKNYFSHSLKFVICFFPCIHFDEKVFEEKIGFYKCDLLSLSSDNSTFSKLFEMYNCEINGDFNFRKVNFRDNVVFTKSKFRLNFILYYTTFYKLAIFSRAVFKNNKGYIPFDISQCIIKQDLIFFGTDIGNYKATFVDFNSQYYDKAMEGHYTPQQNKRETFRIIKQQLVQQDNLIEAEKYAKLEKLSYWQELWKTRNFWKFSSFVSLLLNLISNYYKTSWLVALAFISVSAMLFDLWIGSVSTVYLNTNNSLFKLINPTDISFYEKFENNGYAYRIYLTGKIVIGYGIYQFIQAFRKFR